MKKYYNYYNPKTLATEKQKALLKKWGISHWKNITCSDASELIQDRINDKKQIYRNNKEIKNCLDEELIKIIDRKNKKDLEFGIKIKQVDFKKKLPF